ncbi:2-amino-4-hydroxy-6-hydroxymethyldihydropteridine diphosphokinase [Acetobacterium wieringae]|uniref:Bifunctional folate synthesis protein n=1 Tax=Acetobacterium wieringae TaxID=52694 RepID=A0A1F2PD91_9FIRM|nr:2-amino-4-hydroxy-6-hydroxymethyldihydropteridine diphosphokinase [Acetobacterium wieringae]OFV69370.1 bifunctional folate synthesis protein [Acetobacterium wieringae]TYC87931.1 2-amino-4-hydroxy-6-hydroxymethyldihydropteridine diphosphokinase [Acetobacterium wieringae]
MDKLYIKDFEVFAYHGVFPEEKTLGQKFLISVTLSLDMQEAALTGDLTKSVHYGELCHALEIEFKKESYDLIETAGEMLATYVLKHYPMVKHVSLTIKKPWAPILKSMDTVAIEINRGWHQAFIGLGTNMGDRNLNLTEAITAIKSTPGIEGLTQSTIIETEPWGYTDQDAFLNCVLKIRTTLPPPVLMNRLLEIELELKRERTIHWGPRTIDLDILFYDNLISDDPHVILPHPRIQERTFVMESMAEIAPYFVHPLLNIRMIELFNNLKNA